MSQLAQPRPLTPTQQLRRDRIITAARELVARYGYDGMIMRDVATLAEVSPTTLYNLYNTKDELLLAALRGKLAENLQVAPADSFETGFDYFAAQIHNSVRQTLEEPEYASAITRALMRANPGDPLVKYLIHNMRNGLQYGLEVMSERGELKAKANLAEVAQNMTSSFWATHMMVCQNEVKLTDLEVTLNRLFLSMLMPIAKGKTRKQLETQYNELQAE